MLLRELIAGYFDHFSGSMNTLSGQSAEFLLILRNILLCQPFGKINLPESN
jgi:hypothetical protein